MRKLDHCNIVRLRYFFYSSGEKVSADRRDLSWAGEARGLHISALTGVPSFPLFLSRKMRCI